MSWEYFPFYDTAFFDLIFAVAIVFRMQHEDDEIVFGGIFVSMMYFIHEDSPSLQIALIVVSSECYDLSTVNELASVDQSIRKFDICHNTYLQIAIRKESQSQLNNNKKNNSL